MPASPRDQDSEKRQLHAVSDPLAILNAAAQAIVSLDCDGRVEFANSQASLLLAGDSLADLRGRPIRTYIPFLGSGASDPGVQTWELGGMRLHASGHETCWTDEGTTIAIEYEAAPLYDGLGVSGAVITFRDIGRRLAAERAKDEVIAIVSHELRSPLTAIRAAVGLVAGGQVGSLAEPGRRMMDIALTNTDRLLRLINEMLDLQRLNSGTAHLQIVDNEASNLMRQAADGMRLLAEQSGVIVHVVPAAVRVWGDHDRLVQVLTNLLANAIKFSPSGSAVWLQAELAGNEVVFRVRDQGRGIPASKLETIFDPFAQLEDGDARKGGTGLGLAISRSIVTQHGGHIWAESGIGLGTTIFVAIPLPPAERDMQAEAA